MRGQTYKCIQTRSPLCLPLLYFRGSNLSWTMLFIEINGCLRNNNVRYFVLLQLLVPLLSWGCAYGFLPVLLLSMCKSWNGRQRGFIFSFVSEEKTISAETLKEVQKFRNLTSWLTQSAGVICAAKGCHVNLLGNCGLMYGSRCFCHRQAEIVIFSGFWQHFFTGIEKYLFLFKRTFSFLLKTAAMLLIPNMPDSISTVPTLNLGCTIGPPSPPYLLGKTVGHCSPCHGCQLKQSSNDFSN